MLGIKGRKKDNRKDPWWKRRTYGKINELNNDFGKVDTLIQKQKVEEEVTRYDITKKLQDTTKRDTCGQRRNQQRILAKRVEINRYQQR